MRWCYLHIIISPRMQTNLLLLRHSGEAKTKTGYQFGVIAVALDVTILLMEISYSFISRDR